MKNRKKLKYEKIHDDNYLKTITSTTKDKIYFGVIYIVTW